MEKKNVNEKNSNRKTTTWVIVMIMIAVLIVLTTIIASYYFKQEHNENTLSDNEVKNAIVNNQSTVMNGSNISTNTEVKNKNISETNQTVTNQTTKNKINEGNFTRDEIYEDEAGVTYEDAGISIRDSFRFDIYVGFGTTYGGVYTIKDNKVVCEVVEKVSGSGELLETMMKLSFTFEIINSNKLKLLEIVEDKSEQLKSYEDIMMIGMTYSIK